MTRDSEKAIASLQKYIDSLGDDIQSEEDLNDVLQEFMQKYNAGLNDTHRDPDIYDLEDMADRAPTKKEKLASLQKALALDPNNLDIQREIARTNITSPLAYLDALREMKANADNTFMRPYLEEYVGEFYLQFETRPYIRLLKEMADLYASLDMFTKAAETDREILRLNPDDNTGARFQLIAVYAVMEQEEKAQNLYDSFCGDRPESFFALCMSIVCFKKDEEEKAYDWLMKLCSVNDDTDRFFRDLCEDTMPAEMQEIITQDAYRPDSYSELAVMYLRANNFLAAFSSYYPVWADQSLEERALESSGDISIA